jgi:predicted Zn-dependent peptidase
MARLGGSLTVRGYVRTIEEQLALYHAVTVEHVAKVAERVLSGAPSLAVVGPVSKRTMQSRVARRT